LEKVITFIVVWAIANVIAAFRFALFSNMNKKMVIFSLIMVNLILGGIYIVYQVGLETINKSSLIVIGVVVAAFMFFVYYKYDNEK